MNVNSVMKWRSRPTSEIAVLAAQALLMFIYGVFFIITPGILDNPTIHSNNAIFFIPSITIIFALLGFFFPKPSGVLMIAYAVAMYIAFVLLDRGHLAAFAYSLGPTWPPLLSGLALIWVAKHEAKLRNAYNNI